MELLFLIGSVHLHFTGWWVVFFIFIQIFIEYSVSKRWRPWSDDAFCGVLLCLSDLDLHSLHISHKKDNSPRANLGYRAPPGQFFMGAKLVIRTQATP